MLDSVPAFGIGEYTLLTAVAVVAVVALELCWLRTGIFATAQYWITMAIVFAFQVPVDGWLTKLRDPIVIYNERQMSGVRMPWDIPVEDFGFGFAMVTLAILLWRHRLDRRAGTTRPGQTEAHDPGQPPRQEQETVRTTP
jgi:lycopene cyclase domain-containing protein